MQTNTPAPGQRIAQYLLIAALLLLGAWTLHRFIAALAWAVILAVATWPLYERWALRLRRDTNRFLPAFTFTMIVGLVLMVPIVWGTIVAWRQALVMLRHFAETPSHPVPLPAGLIQLPWIGEWLNELWSDYFAQSSVQPGVQSGGTHMLDRTHMPVMEWTRAFGVQLVKRVAIFGFTLLSLFFVYLHGLSLAADVRRVSQRLFGAAIQPLFSHAVVAIRATVDGIVLVAVAEGALMSGVYAFCGVPHPILFGFITGILAMVPFAAPIAFTAVAASLAMQGSVTAAIVVMAFGVTLLFVVDHFVRPIIIGDATRLPFLWVLLGILGGVESFGLIGLFIGPTLMAVLCSLWRDWAAISAEKLAAEKIAESNPAIPPL